MGLLVHHQHSLPPGFQDAPIISILSTEITIPENQINVVDIVASDADGDPLSYSLSGTDSAYFVISSSGKLSFIILQIMKPSLLLK